MIRIVFTLVVVATLSFILSIIGFFLTGIYGSDSFSFIFLSMLLFVLIYVNNAQVMQKYTDKKL